MKRIQKRKWKRIFLMRGAVLVTFTKYCDQLSLLGSRYVKKVSRKRHSKETKHAAEGKDLILNKQVV